MFKMMSMQDRLNPGSNPSFRAMWRVFCEISFQILTKFAALLVYWPSCLGQKTA